MWEFFQWLFSLLCAASEQEAVPPLCRVLVHSHRWAYAYVNNHSLLEILPTNRIVKHDVFISINIYIYVIIDNDIFLYT